MHTETSKEYIIDKVNDILVDLFEIEKEQLKPEKHLFTDLGLDSLDAIDMVIKFQKEFSIRPSNEELQSIRTVEDVYQLVHRYHDKVQQAN